MRHILLFCISLLIFTSIGTAQEKETVVNDSIVNDTLVKNNKYGLRLGIDLARPVRTLANEDFTGFEIMADYRISKRFYIAVELGNDNNNQIEENLVSSTKGSYAKIGFDYDFYNNWAGMNNSIMAGLRYGFSTFDQELNSFGVYTGDPIFPGTIIEETINYDGLTAHWIEFVFSVKTEIFNNLFLSISLQLKNKVSEDIPENFGNLYIPGFNKTNDFSDFGVGFSYGVSYLIPIYKK
ncbi:MAG: DUF6048 family protein [Flavobacteriaceae bacterium]